jgi:hypothetical protein
MAAQEHSGGMVREVEGSYGAEIVTELFQAKKISTH